MLRSFSLRGAFQGPVFGKMKPLNRKKGTHFLHYQELFVTLRREVNRCKQSERLSLASTPMALLPSGKLPFDNQPLLTILFKDL